MKISKFYKSISEPFKVTNDEYAQLAKVFKKLCYFQAWQLMKKNTKNNHTNDVEDVVQEQLLHLLVAGAYYKRQIYIERCLAVCESCAKDKLIASTVSELASLWENRKRHGANRQKFGLFQENLLDILVQSVVPKKKRPSKSAPLKIDAKFRTYCKSITWNAIKTTGKKITKEKNIRSGLVSLSDFDYLVSC